MERCFLFGPVHRCKWGSLPSKDRSNRSIPEMRLEKRLEIEKKDH